MNVPYIGITDFMNAKQVLRMLHAFSVNGGEKLKRRLMIGVMMSRKTLHDVPTKWLAAFPPKETIRNIFIEDARALNTLHYADYDAAHPTQQLEDLERATIYGGPHMACIQLDMIWPDPAMVQAYRDRHPQIKVIVQANAKALEQTNNNPYFLHEKLWEYEDAIDYVLLDKSMGKGLGMDAAALLPFAETIARHLPHLEIAAAGGLGPDTIHLVEPLAQQFPNISIDAQGKLRPSGNALDPIDWDMAETYLQRSLAMFAIHQKPA